jgi:hypothetical protein
MNRTRMGMLGVIPVAALSWIAVRLLLTTEAPVAPSRAAVSAVRSHETDSTPQAAASVIETHTQHAPARAQPLPVQTAAPVPKPEDATAAPFTFDHETPEDRADRLRERDELGKRWTEEPRDSRWANEASARISDLLARAEQRSSALREVDCRQSICRFELQSATGTQKEAMALIAVARQFEPETWLRPYQQRNGSWRMEVFFPKQGYRLSGGGGRIGETRPVVNSPDLQSPISTEKG